jgi:hypothetical protein
MHVAGIFSGTLQLDDKRTLQDSSDANACDAFIGTFGEGGALENLVHLGGQRDQTIYAMSVDASGRVFVVGSYFGKLLVDDAVVLEAKPALNDRGFLLALDAGKVAFACDLSSTSGATAVAADGKGGAWVAATAGTPSQWALLVLRVDRSGKTTAEWKPSSRIGSSVNAIAVNSKGHAILGGSYDIALAVLGERVFDPPSDAFVLELDETAHIVWKRKIGAPAEVQHLALDSLDRIWLTITSTTLTRFGDTKLDTRSMLGVALAMDSDGSPRFARAFTPWPVTPRFTPLQRLSGTVWENGAPFALDPAGAPVFAVPFIGSFDVGEYHLNAPSGDVALFKLDPRDGRIVWARALGASRFAHTVAVDTNGRAYVGGPTFGQNQAWLASFDP